jgi:hypothetical protein
MNKDRFLASKMKRAKIVDEHSCFHIRDFKSNDSIYFLGQDRQRQKGVVKSVNLDYNIITVITTGGEVETDVSQVTFLDSYRQNWLA